MICSCLGRNQFPRYNHTMLIATIFMRLLEILFFIGLVGSSIVILISFYEDGKELFGKDE